MRKHEDLYDPDRPELEPFRDLVGDMTSDQLGPFVGKIRVRWPELVRQGSRAVPGDPGAAR